jgi:catechol 2,3-dioxygenase-like lactoylglutathione lyase family enzyme
MIHHLSLGVADLERSVRFYDAVLAELGQIRLWRTEGGAGYGSPSAEDELAIFAREGAVAAGAGFHLAFAAPTRGAVDRFHQTGLRAGGGDAGAPGIRTRYAPDYYAAFLTDPDGWKLEAVHRG